MALCPDGHQSDASDYCDVCGLAIGAASAPPARPAGGGATMSSRPGDPCPNCLLPREQGDPFCEGCGFDFAHEAGQATESTPRPSFNLDLEIAKAEQEAARLGASMSTAGMISPTVTSPVTGGGSGSGAGAQPSVTLPPTPGPATPAAGRWTLVANADRAYYDSVVAEGEIDPVTYPFPPYCPERRFTVSGDNLRIGRSSSTRGAVEIDLTGPPTDPGVSHLHAVLQARPDGGWTVLDPGSTNGTVLNDDTAPIPPNQAVPIEAGFRVHVGVWTTLTLVREP